MSEIKISLRGIDKAFTLADHAQEYIDNLGIPTPQQPVTPRGEAIKPVLPADITAMSSEDIGRLYGQFTSMLQYVEYKLGLVDIEHSEDEYFAEMEEAKAGLVADGNNQQQRLWSSQLSDTVKKAKQKALERRAKKVLLQKIASGYDKSIAALSRELSRRTGERY